MANAGEKSAYKPAEWFWKSREKGQSVAGVVTFTALRALDLPFQWWVLRSGAAVDILRRVGLTPVASPIIPYATTAIGLSPYHSLVFGLAVGSSLKQIYWDLVICDTWFPVSFATLISVYNTLLNSFNTVLALWILTSQEPADQSSLKAFIATAPPSLYLGLGLYSVGIFTEWYCEIQRKRFKQNPANKGKPYSGGLFSLARNINYGGYTLWRSGYSLICGGWLWSIAMCTWLAGDFCSRAIPSMDAYCEKRYGEQWQEVRRKVPYKLLPWIY